MFVEHSHKPSFRFLAIRHYQIVEQRDWQPALNMYETDDVIIIVAELAGVEPEELAIDVEPNLVRIQGTRQFTTPDTLRRVHRIEIAAGPFQIEARLPALINPESARSNFQHGLLEIVLPLAQRSPRRLSIGSGEDAAQ
jgi:HSP20 family molecular chaperone IbpA